MKVILISEENHGFLGVAKDYVSAIKWLVKSDWMTQCSQVYDYDNQEFCWFEDWFGDEWLEKILEMTLDQFNELGTSFQLREEEVYSAS